MKQKEIRVLVERGLHTEGYRRFSNIDPPIINLYLKKNLNRYLDSLLKNLRKEGFEDSTTAITDTAQLKSVVSIPVDSPNQFSEGQSYTIAAKSGEVYRDWIRFTVSVTSEYLASAETKKVRILDDEFVTDLLKDTYHKTRYESPLGTIIGNSIRVYTNSDFSVGSGELVYIRKFDEFDVVGSAEDEYPLPDRILNDVIDMTVLEIKKDRVQLSKEVTQ
jgi:fructose-1,6-bisphosphatase